MCLASKWSLRLDILVVTQLTLTINANNFVLLREPSGGGFKAEHFCSRMFVYAAISNINAASLCDFLNYWAC